jgi:hypothetical protein
MGRTACTEPQCLYKGALYLYITLCLQTSYYTCSTNGPSLLYDGKQNRNTGNVRITKQGAFVSPLSQWESNRYYIFWIVSVALGIQHKRRMRHTVICGLPGSTIFFHIIFGYSDSLRLPWLRFIRAFPSFVRQMPGYNSQRLGTANTLPNLLFVLFCC